MADEGNEQNNSAENTGTTFDILFRGELAADSSLEQVKVQVAESFTGFMWRPRSRACSLKFLPARASYSGRRF